MIVYAWVMGCTTITGKEYLPLGRRSSRIMPRAINFFSLSLLPSLAIVLADSRKRSIIIIPPPSFLGWNMLSSTSLDLIPFGHFHGEKQFFAIRQSPVDIWVALGEGRVERFSFEFQSFRRFLAPVFIPMSNPFLFYSFLFRFIPLSNFNECSDLLMFDRY